MNRTDAAALLTTLAVMLYACHEGNYAMTNILAGARAKERASSR